MPALLLMLQIAPLTPDLSLQQASVTHGTATIGAPNGLQGRERTVTARKLLKAMFPGRDAVYLQQHQICNKQDGKDLAPNCDCAQD